MSDLFIGKTHDFCLEKNVLGNSIEGETGEEFPESFELFQLVFEPGVVGFLVVVSKRRFQRTDGLEVGLLESLADSHDFAYRMHLGAELRFGAGEFLKSEARDLNDAVVQGRLKAGGSFFRNVVSQFVQGIANG